MLEIEIKTIPHEKQRYPTCGDYWVSPNGVIHLRVSDLHNWKLEALIVVHELIEFFITRHNGITIDEIDAFDKTFEASRKAGDFSEPGDDPNAPYFKEHQFATLIECALAQKLGINWDEYNKKVEEL